MKYQLISQNIDGYWAGPRTREFASRDELIAYLFSAEFIQHFNNSRGEFRVQFMECPEGQHRKKVWKCSYMTADKFSRVECERNSNGEITLLRFFREMTYYVDTTSADGKVRVECRKIETPAAEWTL